MGRRHRPVSGTTHALAMFAVLVCGAWGGQHGLGVVIGWAVVAAVALALIVGLVRFYIYCWRRMDGPR